MLRSFFRTRLRADPAHSLRPGLPRLLARRTLDRVARRRAAEAPVGRPPSVRPPRARKAEVLRAALMVLRDLDAPASPCPDDAAPASCRN